MNSNEVKKAFDRVNNSESINYRATQVCKAIRGKADDEEKAEETIESLFKDIAIPLLKMAKANGDSIKIKLGKYTYKVTVKSRFLKSSGEISHLVDFTRGTFLHGCDSVAWYQIMESGSCSSPEYRLLLDIVSVTSNKKRMLEVVEILPQVLLELTERYDGG